MTLLCFMLESDSYFCPLNPASDITETTWLKASLTQDTIDTTLRWLLFTWTGVQTSLLQCPTWMLFDLIVAQIFCVINRLVSCPVGTFSLQDPGVQESASSGREIRQPADRD